MNEEERERERERGREREREREGERGRERDELPRFKINIYGPKHASVSTCGAIPCPGLYSLAVNWFN